MIISRKLKESNIAEYILYMWQVEDTIRAFHFDIDEIDRNIIRKYELSREVKGNIRRWYEQLIRMMIREDIREKGHLQLTVDLMERLSSLHHSLLQDPADMRYQELFSKTLPYINEFQQKAGSEGKGVIETCLNGLYALLLLRLQKRKINRDTTEAMDCFRNLISYLTIRYQNR
jgi:hypothetical protein